MPCGLEWVAVVMRPGAREGVDEADDSDPPTCARQACLRS